MAEDLISIADKRQIEDEGRFVKEVFKPDLDLENLIQDESKLRELGQIHCAAITGKS
ncbi:MAG TPA: hypothetical protein VGM63_21470 [Mucilaginibacter sp.]